MDTYPVGPVTHEDVRAYVEQLLRTGLMLTDLIGGLLEDLPPDAFPGESTGEALIEMLCGTVQPAAEAAGPRALAQSAALLGAIGDRTVADLRAALDLTSARSSCPPRAAGRRRR